MLSRQPFKIVAWTYAAAMTLLLLCPGRELESVVGDIGKEGRDVMFHAAMYFIACFLMIFASMQEVSASRIRQGPGVKWSKWHVIPAECIPYYGVNWAYHGLVVECCQYFIPGRSFDLKDLAANWFGVAIAVVLGKIIFRSFKPFPPSSPPRT
eukprot:ANDGO_07038.mRNA.1 hypothetical protein